jgi:mevalonate kinase
MKYCDFTTTTYGKWILAGEHAVIRGHGALVFPIKDKRLTLTYRASLHAPTAQYTGSSGSSLHLLFWSVLEHGLQLIGCSINQLCGHFDLDSSIPVGVGMGASAALCVAVSRWFEAQSLIAYDSINVFARELEHLFHGKSSGLDISGVSSEQGVYFKEGISTPLKPVCAPIWYLSSCNQIGITSHCIQQVQELWDKNPSFAAFIDKQMIESVRICKRALEVGGADANSTIALAINQAAQCFVQWGLVSDSLKQHMTMVQKLGALGVKPTGSGGGGFVLSLWDKVPAVEALEFIAV